MKVDIGSLCRKFEDFSIPVGGAMNLSRVCFGTFNYIFLLVTLKGINNTR
jgi:hypothetical protein